MTEEEERSMVRVGESPHGAELMFKRNGHCGNAVVWVGSGWSGRTESLGFGGS